MSTIDKAALIEQAARASFMRPGMPLAHWERCNEDSREAFSEDAARSLPVIAKALLAPLRELHKPLNEKLWPMDCVDGGCDHWTDDTNSCEDHCPPSIEQVCAHCYEMGTRPDDGYENYFDNSIKWPCPTVCLLDAIEAEVQP